MYDQNFRNQAVKECVNGQSVSATAKKYGVSVTAIRDWLGEYKERMSDMKTGATALVMPSDEDRAVNRSRVELKSININVDGNNITISKKDVIKLMEIFYKFDK